MIESSDGLWIINPEHRCSESTGGDRIGISSSNKDFELMQYTGLKDKNGKEIYEGDIISWKVEEDNGYKRTQFTEVCEVRFDNGNYKFGANETSWWHDLRGTEKEVEVIGNIYENPDLLPSDITK